MSDYERVAQMSCYTIRLKFHQGFLSLKDK